MVAKSLLVAKSLWWLSPCGGSVVVSAKSLWWLSCRGGKMSKTDKIMKFVFYFFALFLSLLGQKWAKMTNF